MKIVVTITPNGAVEGDVKEGPGGAGCVSALLDLLEELGEQEELRKKPAYFQREVNTHNQGKVKL